MTDLPGLQQAMATAIANLNANATPENVKAFEQAAEAITKSKSERHKAEVGAQLKEAEALAGKREMLAKDIHNMVRALALDKNLTQLKSWGFTYKVDKANPNEPDVTYKSVALSTQVIKKAKAGGTGGGGKTKDDYGVTLQEAFDLHKAGYAAAKGMDIDQEVAKATDADATASAKLGKTTNSNLWRVKNEVKKWALGEGLLAPVK